MWPENWVACQIFVNVGTQWRMSAGGPTGLDYNTVKWFMDLMKVKKRDRFETLQKIRTMEAAALNVMNSKGK